MKVLKYSETKKHNLDADIPVYHVYSEILFYLYNQIWMPNNALFIRWQGIEKSIVASNLYMNYFSFYY